MLIKSLALFISCTEYLDKIKFKDTEINCQTEEISRQETISVSIEEAVGMFKTAPTEEHLLCCTGTIGKMFSRENSTSHTFHLLKTCDLC